MPINSVTAPHKFIARTLAAASKCRGQVVARSPTDAFRRTMERLPAPLWPELWRTLVEADDGLDYRSAASLGRTSRALNERWRQWLPADLVQRMARIYRGVVVRRVFSALHAFPSLWLRLVDAERERQAYVELFEKLRSVHDAGAPPPSLRTVDRLVHLPAPAGSDDAQCVAESIRAGLPLSYNEAADLASVGIELPACIRRRRARHPLETHTPRTWLLTLAREPLARWHALVTAHGPSAFLERLEHIIFNTVATTDADVDDDCFLDESHRALVHFVGDAALVHGSRVLDAVGVLLASPCLARLDGVVARDARSGAIHALPALLVEYLSGGGSMGRLDRCFFAASPNFALVQRVSRRRSAAAFRVFFAAASTLFAWAPSVGGASRSLPAFVDSVRPWRYSVRQGLCFEARPALDACIFADMTSTPNEQHVLDDANARGCALRLAQNRVYIDGTLALGDGRWLSTLVDEASPLHRAVDALWTVALAARTRARLASLRARVVHARSAVALVEAPRYALPPLFAAFSQRRDALLIVADPRTLERHWQHDERAHDTGSAPFTVVLAALRRRPLDRRFTIGWTTRSLQLECDAAAPQRGTLRCRLLALLEAGAESSVFEALSHCAECNRLLRTPSRTGALGARCAARKRAYSTLVTDTIGENECNGHHHHHHHPKTTTPPDWHPPPLAH